MANKTNAEISYRTYCKDGILKISAIHTVNGFWGAIKQLWLFWHFHETHLSDFDTMTITFSPFCNEKQKEVNCSDIG